MAAVITDAGLTADAGIEKAREHLMENMERIIEEGVQGKAMESMVKREDRTGAVGKFLNGRAFGPEVVEQSKGLLTDALMTPMRERFDSFDANKDGLLEYDELSELI